MIVGRRGFIAGLAAVFAAPAIVRVEALMPIRGVPMYAGDNSLLTIDMITREAIRLFKNSNVFLQNLDAQYNDAFAVEGAKIGSTLRIRLPSDSPLLAGQPLYKYNKELRTLLPNVPDLQLPAPVAIAAGVVAVAAKNPVVSRRNLFGRAA